jgi:uncharacterized protein YoxC
VTQAWADANGVAVESMSAEQKQLALLEGVLESGDRMLEQVGGSVDEMGDSFAQLETKVKNATDSLKEEFARSLLGIGPALERTVDLLFDLDGVMEDNQKTALEGADSYEEYALTLIRAAQDSGQILQREAKALENYVTGVTDAGWRTKELADEIGLMTDVQWGGVRATEAMNQNISGLPNQIDWWREETEKAIPPVRDLSKDTEDLAGNVELVAQMMSDRAARAADDFKGSMDNLHMAMSGEVGEAYEEYMGNIAELDQALAEGELSQDEYRSSVEEVTAAFRENTRALAFNIAEKQILDALENDLIEDVNNSGTAYDEATQMLWTLGEQMGLVDEATVNFIGSVQEQTQAMIDGKIGPEELGAALNNTAAAARTAESDITKVDDAARGLPSDKVVNIRIGGDAEGTVRAIRSKIDGLHDRTVHVTVKTNYVNNQPGWGGATEGYQHGGQFTVRGPAGVDRVPVGFMATRGEVVTVTPVGGQAPANPVTNNYNLNVTSSQPSGGIANDFYIMQALAG